MFPPPKLLSTLRSVRVRLLASALICLLPVGAGFFAQRHADLDRIDAENVLRANALADQLKANVVNKLQAFESVAHVMGALAHTHTNKRTAGRCYQPLASAARAAPVDVLNFSVLDAAGTVLCSALPAPNRASFADRPYFQRAVATGQPAVSDYTFGRITNTHAVQLAVPQVDDRHRVKAVAVVAVRPWALLADLLPQPHGDVMLAVLDSAGTRLARFPASGALPPGKPFLLPRETLDAHDGGHVRVQGPDGVLRDYAVRSVHYPAGHAKLWVVAGVDAEHVLAAAAAARRQSAGVLLAVLIVVAAIAWLLHAEGERQQREIQAHLEDQIAHRTRELELANAELHSFSQSISHDLKAPIHTIANFANVLMQRPMPWGDKEKHYLARIHAASVHGFSLIDGMLELSNVGRRKLDLREVDLADLARESLTALGAKSTQLAAPAQLRVRGDRALLKILMENLVGNSVKFSAPGRQATIRLAREVEDGQEVYSLRDNGVGFDENYAGKLFEPFQRLHTPNEFPGTGLGLATVRKVIERHGGRVWANSTLGQGTTVSFTLWSDPRSAVSAAAPIAEWHPLGSTKPGVGEVALPQ